MLIVDQHVKCADAADREVRCQAHIGLLPASMIAAAAIRCSCVTTGANAPWSRGLLVWLRVDRRSIRITKPR